jgi:hypothetical protein
MLVSIATVLTFLSCSHVRRIIATEQERPGPASRESHRTDEESRLLLRRGKPRAVRLSERSTRGATARLRHRSEDLQLSSMRVAT